MRFALIALVLVAIVGIVWTQQRRLIYFPFGAVPDPRTIGVDGTTQVSFPTADGLMLNGWFITRTDTPDFTVIVFNGKRREPRVPRAAGGRLRSCKHGSAAFRLSRLWG